MFYMIYYVFWPRSIFPAVRWAVSLEPDMNVVELLEPRVGDQAAFADIFKTCTRAREEHRCLLAEGKKYYELTKMSTDNIIYNI